MIDLRKGDCLKLMHDIQDKSIDLILCDLPYGKTKNLWDKAIPMDALWGQYNRIIKDTGAVLLFGSGIFSARLILSNPRMFRYDLEWVKTTPTGFLNANRAPLRAHEDILVFYKHLPTYNPQKTHEHTRKTSTAEHKRNCAKYTGYGLYENKGYDSTDRFPTSILAFKSDRQTCHLHPTQKPVALLEYLIRTYTNEGDTVLDNCMGSGSTGVACVNTGRNFIGMELDDNYFDIAKSRLFNL